MITSQIIYRFRCDRPLPLTHNDIDEDQEDKEPDEAIEDGRYLQQEFVHEECHFVALYNTSDEIRLQRHGWQHQNSYQVGTIGPIWPYDQREKAYEDHQPKENVDLIVFVAVVVL